MDKASYSFEKGTLYTIVGPSGSGKTTTLTLAGALEEPKSGCVCFEGKDIREIGYTRYRNSKIGIVFQAYNLLPYLTPLENVLAAMEKRTGAGTSDTNGNYRRSDEPQYQ